MNKYKMTNKRSYRLTPAAWIGLGILVLIVLAFCLSSCAPAPKTDQCIEKGANICTPEAPTSTFVPPRGYSWVGRLGPGDACETSRNKTGVMVSNRGPQQGKIDLLLSPDGKKTLTKDSPATEVDGFLFVLGNNEDVSVYAPTGQTCLWHLAP